MIDLAEIWVPEPQNNSKNNGTNFTRGHMGQIPVIRCLVQNFYMVAYGTKAGLGTEPEFDSRRQVLPGRPVPSLFKLRQGV